MREHTDQFGPGILLVLLPLLLEDGPDVVQRAVELVLLLEAEVQFSVLQRIHHIPHLLNVAPAHMDGGDDRRDDRDDDDKQYDLPKCHLDSFASLGMTVTGRISSVSHTSSGG